MKCVEFTRSKHISQDGRHGNVGLKAMLRLIELTIIRIDLQLVFNTTLYEVH